MTQEKLSDHFTLAEMIASQEATRRGIDNTPTQDIIENLVMLCRGTLEPVRGLLARPIFVSSGYRCKELNEAIGGALMSDHQTGLAADFACHSYGTPLEVCKAIAKSGILFGQLIHEFGRWVHISHGTKRELLTATKRAGKTVYLRGLHPV